MSVLLVGIMAMSFMSIALTGRMSRGRIQHRAAAAASIRRVSESLKSFVTADQSLARGPGNGVDGWSLPGDFSSLTALDAGVHPLSVATWAPELEPLAGEISYVVAVRNTDSGPQPTVSFNVSWVEP